jgi:hypothetical protein
MIATGFAAARELEEDAKEWFRKIPEAPKARCTTMRTTSQYSLATHISKT